MTPRQRLALEAAHGIELDELRARAIMLILANNVEGMRALEIEAYDRNDVDLSNWTEVERAADYLLYGRTPP